MQDLKKIKSDKTMLYPFLKTRFQALTGEIRYPLANLANTSALIYELLEDINWAGFYLLQNNLLILGPFQGRPACVRIPIGNGVCGTAVQNDEAIVVPDVHKFPGHIACDSASRSEIVIPIHADGKVVGVLDIDSPILSRFDTEDLNGLMAIIKLMEQQIPSFIPLQDSDK